LRIDVVEPRSPDQRIPDGDAVGAAEQPQLAAERDAAPLTFCGIVGELDAPAIEKARERDPSP
jgi:hypothetical protein